MSTAFEHIAQLGVETGIKAVDAIPNIEAIVLLVLGIIFCFFGLKYHLYLQYALTFIAGAFFGVRLLGMASDLLPGDLINADNEQYIGGAIGILLCLGIFFYNFWFYRILSACAGFGIAGGLTIVVGLFVPIVVDYVLYVAAVGAVAGIFFYVLIHPNVRWHDLFNLWRCLSCIFLLFFHGRTRVGKNFSALDCQFNRLEREQCRSQRCGYISRNGSWNSYCSHWFVLFNT